MALVDEGKNTDPLDPKSLLQGKPQKYLSLSKRNDLLTFVKYISQFDWWLKNGDDDGDDNEILDFSVEQIAHKQRPLMDILGPHFSYLMWQAQLFKEKKISLSEFKKEFIKFKRELCAFKAYTISGLRELICSKMTAYDEFFRWQLGDKSSELLPSREHLLSAVTINGFRIPTDGDRNGDRDRVGDRVVREFEGSGIRYQRIQDGVYTASKETLIQRAIDELATEGGKIYHIVDKELGSGKNASWSATSFFKVDEEGIPQINIDMLSNNYALSSLAHELAHFHHWKNIRDGLLSAGGYTVRSAALKAKEMIVNDASRREIDERLAVEAELRQEDSSTSSIFNRGRYKKETNPLEISFISRAVYPSVVKLETIFNLNKAGTKTETTVKLSQIEYQDALKTMHSMLTEALKIRQSSYAHYKKMLSSGEQKKITAKQKAAIERKLKLIYNSSPFYLIFHRDYDSFVHANNKEPLAQIYRDVFRKISLSPVARSQLAIDVEDDLGRDEDELEIASFESMNVSFEYDSQQQ